MTTKTTTQKAPAGELLLIPLSRLRPSRRNVRKSRGPRRQQSIAQLAESIARVGLLQNIVVSANLNGEDFDIEAGERRYRAMKLLVKQKRLDKDADVASLRVAKVAARTASLTENVQREAIHPADEFEAFADLVAEGRAIEDIAADFGVTPLVVKRRLKLANVSPRLMADYRDGGVTLEQLMALAITDDHAAQEAAFYDAPQWQRDPHDLRARLTEREIDAARDPLARFVGVDAYEQASGAVRRDLFSDDAGSVYLSDAALLESLARTKLADMAEKVNKEGWAWVDVAPRATHADLQEFRRAPQERREPKAGEAKRIAKLEAQAQAIEARLDAEDEDLDEAAMQALYERQDRITAKLDAIADTLRTYSAKIRAFAGAVVTVDAHGEVAVHRGLLREDVAKVLRTLDAGGEFVKDADPPAATSPRKGGISEKLARRLSAHRTAALQIELSRKPQVALAAVVYELVRTVLLEGLDEDFPELPLGIRAESQEQGLLRHAEDLPQSPAFTTLVKMRSCWRDQLLHGTDNLMELVLGLPQDMLLELLAVCVAATVNVVTSHEDDDNADALARAVGLDMHTWWTPTAESYFAHVPKAASLAAVQAFAPDYGGCLSKLKKDELVAKAERLAAGKGWLPPMFARQATWIDPPADDAEVDAEAAGAEAQAVVEAEAEAGQETQALAA